MRVDSESKDGAIGVVEIGTDLVDFKYFTVIVTGVAQWYEGCFSELCRCESELSRVFKRGALSRRKAVGVDLSGKQGGAHRCRPIRVFEQAFKTGKMMVDAVGALIQVADPDANQLEQPFRQLIA